MYKEPSPMSLRIIYSHTTSGRGRNNTSSSCNLSCGIGVVVIVVIVEGHSSDVLFHFHKVGGHQRDRPIKIRVQDIPKLSS